MANLDEMQAEVAFPDGCISWVDRLLHSSSVSGMGIQTFYNRCQQRWPVYTVLGGLCYSDGVFACLS